MFIVKTGSPLREMWYISIAAMVELSKEFSDSIFHSLPMVPYYTPLFYTSLHFCWLDYFFYTNIKQGAPAGRLG
jgi:hypothetical protein